MRDPIVVIGCARSGTSMTAGLFARHGCWTGRCREPDRHNAKGYFENLDVKQGLLRRWGKLKQKERMARPSEADGFRETVERICRKAGDRHWVVKHGSLYWPAWRDFNATFVCVYRPPEQIMASAGESMYMTPEAICLTQGAMEWCIQHAGGVRVDSPRLIRGDYAQIERAFSIAGLEFQPHIADEWIDADLWHHGEAA